ncbi:MAG: phosphopyruvate hydratase [Gammaproteobacteria bacterium]|nr:phosphopyruvate hydratase [Gammaproteobacteria bacterium]MDE0251331.1 phosphopyruvate hydratase [Gammaproteobacteria bacterium]MDE0401985.1 phosphopyruvate hydratase [Gammaproteobacteria bacterium]
MSVIDRIRALEILDSRGFPTLETTVTLKSGACGSFIVPSGASVGTAEAVELRDHDARRYLGKGVKRALYNVDHHIARVVCECGTLQQQELDQMLIELDGTENKSHLGANAILSVSVAFARAQAQERKTPVYAHIAELANNSDIRLPVPMMNFLNGGAHANNSLDFQEFMIIPVGAPNMAAAIRGGAEVFQCLKLALEKAGHLTTVGDEGGFAPNLSSHDEAFGYLCDAITAAGFEVGVDIVLALDCAATELYQEGTYTMDGMGGSASGDQLCEILAKLVSKYPIVSIEDGMAEDDWKSWQTLSTKLGNTVQLVGDDIFVTNPKFLKRGIELGVANSILIKLNQIGTLTETLEVIQIAKNAGYSTVVSHRSGDTEDSFIADFAVGTGAGQLKTGSLSRSERTSKYNQLLRIEAEQGHMEFRGLNEISKHKDGGQQCEFSS